MATKKPTITTQAQYNEYVKNGKEASKQKYIEDSKKRRHDQAVSSGLQGDFLSAYENYDNGNPYEYGTDQFNSYEEYARSAEADYFNDLVRQWNERNYNSEQAKAERLRAAGINPDITGGESLGQASEMSEHDSAVGSNSATIPTIVGNAIAERNQHLQQFGTVVGALTSAINLGSSVTQAMDMLESRRMSDYVTLSDKVQKAGGYLPFFGLQATDSGGFTDLLASDDSSKILTKEAAINIIKERASSFYPYSPRRRKHLEGLALDALNRASSSSRSGIVAEDMSSRNKAVDDAISLNAKTGSDPTLVGLDKQLSDAQDSDYAQFIAPMIKAQAEANHFYAKIERDFAKEYNDIEITYGKGKDKDGNPVDLKAKGGAIDALNAKYMSMIRVKEAQFKVQQQDYVRKLVNQWSEDLNAKGVLNAGKRHAARNKMAAFANGTYSQMSGGFNLFDVENDMLSAKSGWNWLNGVINGAGAIGAPLAGFNPQQEANPYIMYGHGFRTTF